MNIDLTQEIKEPNGTPLITLGGLIYRVLTQVPAKDFEEAKRFHALSFDIVGRDSHVFTTQQLGRLQEMVKELSDTRLRVPGYEMLEIKGRLESKPAAK